MKLLVLDNYDSFTYNLVHILRELLPDAVTVARNDKIELAEVGTFDKILLSPGPGIPEEAGIMPAVVKTYASSKSILGICLGHQCIGEQFGGTLLNLDSVVHGKPGVISVCDDDEYLFAGIEHPFEGGRYHSWVVAEAEFPDCLAITARSQDGAIMGLRHRTHDVRGLQFHPESVLTGVGTQLLKNWVMR